MDIACLFIKRKHLADSPPELIAAWDGWSIEENWQGWAEACETALKSVESDLHSHRFVNVKVPLDAIDDLFSEYVGVEAEGVSELDDPASL